MASPSLTPGSSSWRTRFLVTRRKEDPLLVRIHDAHYRVDFWYRFASENDIRHHINQLRLGYTDRAPDGVLAAQPCGGR